MLVEYSLLLTFFAIPAIAGVTHLGGALLTEYRSTRDYILKASP